MVVHLVPRVSLGAPPHQVTHRLAFLGTTHLDFDRLVPVIAAAGLLPLEAVPRIVRVRHAAGLAGRECLAGPLADEAGLHLGEHGKDGQHHLAEGGGGIEGEADVREVEQDALPSPDVGLDREVSKRSKRPVELRDHQPVAAVNSVAKVAARFPFEEIQSTARRRVDEDFHVRPQLMSCRELKDDLPLHLGALVLLQRRGPDVAVCFHSSSSSSATSSDCWT